MWKGMKVIDADAHMHEPQDMWERYVEPAYRDRVPKVAYMNGTFMIYEPDGVLIPKGKPQRVPPPTAWEDIEEKYGEAYHTWWAPETRLKEMDRYGWDIQVLLPTGNNGNFAPRASLTNVELGAAMCRAYNNWARDYCSEDSSRLKFVAVLPGDLEEAVKEARRAVTELGAVSVRNLVLPEGQWLHDPEFDALWELASDLDFPIAVHGEWRQHRFQPFKDAGPEERHKPLKAVDHAIGFPSDNMTTVGQFIFTRILERFPKLRLGILESNVGWAPFWLGRMDLHSHGRNSVMSDGERLPKLPSEYFTSQCIVTCDGDERALHHTIEDIGDDIIAWNTDYPHPDAPNPAEALPDLDAQPIREESKRKILWDNAVKLYGPRILSASP